MQRLSRAPKTGEGSRPMGFAYAVEIGVPRTGKIHRCTGVSETLNPNLWPG